VIPKRIDDMRIPSVRVLFVLALSALLGGCLQSSQPLIASSPFSDTYVGAYTVSDGIGGKAEDKMIRLRKNGGDLVREDYDAPSKSWKPSDQRFRFTPYQGRKGEALVQISDGKSYAYLYYRAQGTDKALLWTIDCSRLAQAAREALKITGAGKDCKVTGLDQVEGAIRAYLLTDPKPDYRIAIRDRGSHGNALSPLVKQAMGLNSDEMLKSIRAIAPSLDNEAGDNEADPDSFGNRAATPIGQTWAALREGDFSGAWRAILHSWIIFALIAFVIGIVITRRC
jgi:hypothetical protein